MMTGYGLIFCDLLHLLFVGEGRENHLDPAEPEVIIHHYLVIASWALTEYAAFLIIFNIFILYDI